MSIGLEIWSLATAMLNLSIHGFDSEIDASRLAGFLLSLAGGQDCHTKEEFRIALTRQIGLDADYFKLELEEMRAYTQFEFNLHLIELRSHLDLKRGHDAVTKQLRKNDAELREVRRGVKRRLKELESLIAELELDEEGKDLESVLSELSLGDEKSSLTLREAKENNLSALEGLTALWKEQWEIWNAPQKDPPPKDDVEKYEHEWDVALKSMSSISNLFLSFLRSLLPSISPTDRRLIRVGPLSENDDFEIMHQLIAARHLEEEDLARAFVRDNPLTELRRIEDMIGKGLAEEGKQQRPRQVLIPPHLLE